MRMGVSFEVRLLGLRKLVLLLRLGLELRFGDGLDLGFPLAEVAGEEGEGDQTAEKDRNGHNCKNRIHFASGERIEVTCLVVWITIDEDDESEVEMAGAYTLYV